MAEFADKTGLRCCPAPFLRSCRINSVSEPRLMSCSFIRVHSWQKKHRTFFQPRMNTNEHEFVTKNTDSRSKIFVAFRFSIRVHSWQKKHRIFKSGLKKHYILKIKNISIFGAGHRGILRCGKTPVRNIDRLMSL